ncbi:Tfp pilus assembly protein PilN [Rubidibacter lacunae KORDI 51-2]|uniref:Tfp pilus assembly protein PilN n=1 Tax=Rubidibacter lacunae KORDI 51-2 TaxID=582515 RepID=U5DQB9_9CHRO|nr:PilN domain-containing protein [Rubidibacter lacunae]ERN43037.1 Tfp pilus assembly protein PilN [Rubidibacter lacunae KORDI 51-2]
MYSLDVNFLKERRSEGQPQKDAVAASGVTASAIGSGNNVEGGVLPLAIGGVVALVLPLGMFAYWYLTQQQIASVERENAELQGELDTLTASQEKLEAARAQLATTQAEAEALANIFNDIKPSAALLQDLHDRIPDNVQVESILQANDGIIKLSGLANDFQAVNHFVLTLKRSDFLAPNSTNLESALQTVYPSEAVGAPEGVVPKLIVKYNIVTQLNDKPASELLPQLVDKGANGLVTRIRTLEERDLI